ncbi:MAG TPA: PqiA/YebS family transporter subunit [Rhizomicrobium sp.]
MTTEAFDESNGVPSAREQGLGDKLIECPHCGLLQVLPPPISGYRRLCNRCGSSFGGWGPGGDIALALAATALVLFSLAYFSPMMAIDIDGRGQSVRVGSGITGLLNHGLAPLALLVLFISVVAPLGRVTTLAYVVFRARQLKFIPHLPFVLRVAELFRPWSMLDVFLVGSLVALTKLHDLAQTTVGMGLWALGLLVATLATLEIAIDRQMLWDSLIWVRSGWEIPLSRSYSGCRECGLVQSSQARCLRCGAYLHRRKPNSLQNATALVATGFILYLPANLYPVITVVSFGHRTTATIMGGVMQLLDGSDWPLALIVFAASVAVPLLKLLGLSALLISTGFGYRARLVDRTRLYRLIEFVGRWSTVDIFVAALLTALVTLGNIATIEPGIGALAFGAVVVVTMLATACFDPRLMWDAAGADHV